MKFIDVRVVLFKLLKFIHTDTLNLVVLIERRHVTCHTAHEKHHAINKRTVMFGNGP
jgi:hypothetical protein